MLSDVIYRTYLHQWTCHPDQEDAIRARKTNEILSDVGSPSGYIHIAALSLLMKTAFFSYCRCVLGVLQGRSDLDEGHWLLCLGHSGDCSSKEGL